MHHLRRRSTDNAAAEFRIMMGSEAMDSPLLAPKSPRTSPVARFNSLGNWTEARDEMAPLQGPVPEERASSGRRRWGWRRILGYSVPVVGLAGLIVAGTERHTIITLRRSLDLVRTTVEAAFHSSHYMCPLATSPRPTNPFTSLSKFVLLESAQPSFAISLAYDLAACNQFRIKIANKDPSVCQRSTWHKVREDPEEQAYVAKRIGPVTFHLHVEGAERLARLSPDRFDPDECASYYDFRLSIPGTVWLNIIHVLPDPDRRSDTPTSTSLLPHPLQLNLCGSMCQTFISPLLSSPSSVFDPLNPPPRRPPPACTGPDPIPGTYVATSLPSRGSYDFVPSGCEFQHNGLRFRDHSSCLLETRGVLFTGDSHGQVMFDVIQHRLEGGNVGVRGSQKVAMKSGRVGNLRLEFILDASLSLPVDCTLLRDIDSIVLSTSSHLSSLKCDSTSTTSHLSEIFTSWPRRLDACGRPLTFIYINSPAAIPSPQDEMECRTASRMEYWSRRTWHLARENGWQVVDAFAHSLPFVIEPHRSDASHDVGNDALDPLADELIDKLGICGSDGPRR